MPLYFHRLTFSDKENPPSGPDIHTLHDELADCALEKENKNPANGALVTPNTNTDLQFKVKRTNIPSIGADDDIRTYKEEYSVIHCYQNSLKS